MKTVVITGSTRGIGFGLAKSYLELGHRVVISGRGREAVERALATLTADFSPDHLLGVPCDVLQYAQVRSLWDRAVSGFGGVDIWVNNAGVAHPQTAFWAMDPARVSTVVRTNLVGAMYGARVALAGMVEQGRGALYNMEGLGSDSRRVEGLTLYGTTKYGLRYLTESLADEVEGTGLIVGAMSPGMVITDLITDQYEGKSEQDWERGKRIFNILADRVETVAPWLAAQSLENQKNGARIAWLSRGKILWRFLSAPFRQRDLFAVEEGGEQPA